MRLHRGGRWRGWLGARLGGGPELGDRAWRRFIHATGALILIYYAVPPGVFFGVPNAVALVIALAAALALEIARRYSGLELPTIRPHEEGRVASFAYYAVGLVIALLFFPRPVAVAVILGAALVDPLIGELRSGPTLRRLYPTLAFSAYVALAAAALRWVGGWSLLATAIGAVVAAAVALAVERPRVRYLDDDLTMTVVPGVLLLILLWAVPGLPSVGGG